LADDDRVVDIEKHILVGIVLGQQGGLVGQVAKEPGRDGVELAHMPESELAPERPQHRGCVTGGEEFPHPAMVQHHHIVDRVRAGDHPAHQRRHL